MTLYINRKHRCDYCGELARGPRHEDTPERWNTGQPIKPIRNKAVGIKCADCQWSDFSDFCHSQGASPHNPVKYFS